MREPVRPLVVVLALALFPAVSPAQPTRDLVNNNTLNHGSTIRDLLGTLELKGFRCVR